MPPIDPSSFASDPRVEFAAERTLLAWIRTSLALMGFGFVVARFGLFLREIAHVREVAPPPHTTVSFWTGTALLLLGIGTLLLAAAQHVHVIRQLRAGEVRPIRPSMLGMGLTAILVVIGIALTAYVVITVR